MPNREVMPNPESSWEEYFEAAADKPVHPLYKVLEPFLPKTGTALEVGCGVGQGALFLAEKGLQVLAVDAKKEPLEVLQSKGNPRVETKMAFIEDLDFYRPFDVVVAGFSLFFVDPSEFESTWNRIVSWVRRGGLLMAQFLGPNDSWASGGYCVQTQDEIRRLIAPFEILHYDHVEREGSTVQGHAKHWDVTHFIGRRSVDPLAVTE
ncbi:MAG TPA: class I SAM-dependent methyltransferase [Fimbriimonas sp.]|nr:class I SAM-dependent methyltransferase [Fimbriimonas sp.]